MATATDNIVILNSYFAKGGDLNPGGPSLPTVLQAMRELVREAGYDKTARNLFAIDSIFEKTLSPPLLVETRFVNPAIQDAMLSGIHRIATGSRWFGFWLGGWQPDPSGITTWLGSEAGGRAYFLATLFGGPRVVNGMEIPMSADVMADLLKIIRDVALPASWFQPMLEQDVFKKLEARVGAADWPGWVRRNVAGLVSAAAGRVQREVAGPLSKLALGAFPAFPTGETLPSGARAIAPTPPPPPRPWYRSGWLLAAGGVALVGGAWTAKR